MTHFSRFRSFLLFAALVIFSSKEAMAAAPPPPNGPPCWPPPCVPIDGGLIFLIVAGIALGGWKIYTSYKKNAVH
jgi:hypothetical protein